MAYGPAGNVKKCNDKYSANSTSQSIACITAWFSDIPWTQSQCLQLNLFELHSVESLSSMMTVLQIHLMLEFGKKNLVFFWPRVCRAVCSVDFSMPSASQWMALLACVCLATPWRQCWRCLCSKCERLATPWRQCWRCLCSKCEHLATPWRQCWRCLHSKHECLATP